MRVRISPKPRGLHITPPSPAQWLEERGQGKSQTALKHVHHGCHLLSFVGSVFFSCVSVFLSLDASNVSTSPRSGLSAMTASAAGKSCVGREVSSRAAAQLSTYREDLDGGVNTVSQLYSSLLARTLTCCPHSRPQSHRVSRPNLIGQLRK